MLNRPSRRDPDLYHLLLVTSLPTGVANSRHGSKLFWSSPTLAFTMWSRSSLFEPSETRTSVVILAFPTLMVNRRSRGLPSAKAVMLICKVNGSPVPPLGTSSPTRSTCLEENHAFLAKGDVFSDELIETFISYKMKAEADAVRLRPHPYEFALYYDI